MVWLWCSVILAGTAQRIPALDWPGEMPGAAAARVSLTQVWLENNIIAGAWSIEGGTLRPARMEVGSTDKQTCNLTGMELFRLVLSDGKEIKASDLKVVKGPLRSEVGAEPGASILARRFPGQQLSAILASADGNLQVEWRAVLRDGANAIRQELTFSATQSAIPIKETRLIELPAEGTRVVGTVPGSPLVVGNALGSLFFTYEHPDSRSLVAERATASLPFNLAVQPGYSVLQSCAIGFAPAGQLRRAFLYYVERERAHPYRPFLHYNAWYDICWGDRKINEAECLAVIDVFGKELIENRNVKLDSFVWDDGWDDPKTLWRPLAANFPNGFDKILAAARERNSTLGFWLSPFGGYGKPKEDRIAMGKAQGFETGPEGFSLAGTNYYARFYETCSEFIDKNGANFFKFDGLARSVNETEAMLRLTRALRARKPDLFISITTGTWPSPFWLWYGDSTWRGGGDMGFHGPGSKREQWMTYRDMETYSNVVQAAPLYPLNSLMNQGFAHAQYGSAMEVGHNPDEIRRELRSLFASGTCLQELYVTPTMMSEQNWADLAECVKWARANADVLVDTHWVGGDPAKGQPYGWASCAPRKGILALRNPSSKAASIRLAAEQVFELPPGAPPTYLLKTPWADEGPIRNIRFTAGQPRTFELQPFEVQVYDAIPQTR
jgi:hypothetical protein